MSISCSCKREFRPRGGYACAASNDAAPIWKIRQSGISRSAKSRSTTVFEISAVSIAHSSRVSIPRRRPFVAFGRITGAVRLTVTYLCKSAGGAVAAAMDVDNTAMTALKVGGWWVTSLAEVDLPAPQELVGDLSPSIRAALIKHLTSG